MTGPGVPQLKRKVEKLAEIVTYATSEAAGLPVGQIPTCRRRPGRKPCKSALDIYLDEEKEQIYWYCNSCHDEGVVSGWRGLIWDMLDAPHSGQLTKAFSQKTCPSSSLRSKRRIWAKERVPLRIALKGSPGRGCEQEVFDGKNNISV
jgi:hypothetical protein